MGIPNKGGTFLRIPILAIVFQVISYLRIEHFADYVGVHLFMETTVFVRRLVMCLEGARQANGYQVRRSSSLADASAERLQVDSFLP